MLTDANWQRALARLRSEIGHHAYDTWFGRLMLMGIEGQVVRASLPTTWLVSWVNRHYVERIASLLKEEEAGARFELVHRPLARAWKSSASAPRTAHPNTSGAGHQLPEPAPTIRSSPIDPRMTFDAFRVSDRNRLAHAAGVAVARGEGGEFNPLFIYGGIALGKTHLLHAIAAAAGERAQNVVHLSAARFFEAAAAGLKGSGTLVALTSGADIVIIDDIHELQGRIAQVALLQLLGEASSSGLRVVLAADRPPAELDLMDARLRSRLSGGLVVELSAFDAALVHDIIMMRASKLRVQHPDFDLPSDVLAFVTEHCPGNGRDVDGVMCCLLAQHLLTGEPLTLERARLILGDRMRTIEPRRITISDIQSLVARRCLVSRADILSQRRSANVVKPRQMAMYLAKTLTLRSLPEIGRRFGGRDHTTVLHAVRKIEQCRRADTSLDAELTSLAAELAAGVSP